MFGRYKHKWEVKGWSVISIYGDEFGNNTKYPTSFRTNATLVCSNCGKVKAKSWSDKMQDLRENG